MAGQAVVMANDDPDEADASLLAKLAEMNNAPTLDDLRARFPPRKDVVQVPYLPESRDPFCPKHGRRSRPITIEGLRCDCPPPK